MLDPDEADFVAAQTQDALGNAEQLGQTLAIIDGARDAASKKSATETAATLEAIQQPLNRAEVKPEYEGARVAVVNLFR